MEWLGTRHSGGKRIWLDPQTPTHPEVQMSGNAVSTLWLTSLVPHESRRAEVSG